MSTSKTTIMKSAMQPVMCAWFKRYREKKKNQPGTDGNEVYDVCALLF